MKSFYSLQRIWFSRLNNEKRQRKEGIQKGFFLLSNVAVKLTIHMYVPSIGRTTSQAKPKAREKRIVSESDSNRDIFSSRKGFLDLIWPCFVYSDPELNSNPIGLERQITNLPRDVSCSNAHGGRAYDRVLGGKLGLWRDSCNWSKCGRTTRGRRTLLIKKRGKGLKQRPFYGQWSTISS